MSPVLGIFDERCFPLSKLQDTSHVFIKVFFFSLGEVTSHYGGHDGAINIVCLKITQRAEYHQSVSKLKHGSGVRLSELPCYIG